MLKIQIKRCIMKKIVSSGLIVMLLSSYVMGGEALDASKKFWSGVSSSTTGSGANPLMKAALTVGAAAAMGVSNLVAMGIDSVSDNNTSIDANKSISNLNTTIEKIVIDEKSYLQVTSLNNAAKDQKFLYAETGGKTIFGSEYEMHTSVATYSDLVWTCQIFKGEKCGFEKN